MHIEEIKQQVSVKTGSDIKTLMLVRQKEEATGNDTPWVAHWDNDNRVRISMHDDVLAKLQENKERKDLAYKLEEVVAEGDRKAYTRVVVITPNDVVATY